MAPPIAQQAKCLGVRNKCLDYAIMLYGKNDYMLGLVDRP